MSHISEFYSVHHNIVLKEYWVSSIYRLTKEFSTSLEKPSKCPNKTEVDFDGIWLVSVTL